MANESAVRAGRAFVELFADDSKLVRGLNGAKQKLTAFGSQVTSIGKWVFAGGMGAATIWATTAKEIGRASQRTGMSTEMFSGLAYAAKKSGLDVEAFEGGIRKMQKTLFAAAEGGAEEVDIIERLGLSVEDLLKATPDQQLGMFADAIGALADPTEQAGVAMKIFGKTGTVMIPFLERGSDGIKQLAGEAKELGQVFSKEDCESAKEFNKALGGLIAQGKALTFAIGSAVAPVMADFLTDAKNATAAVIEWVKNNQELVVTGVKIAAGFVAVGLVCSTLAKTIGGISTAVKMASTAMTFFAAHPAIAALLAVGVVTAALVARANMKGTAETKAADKDVSATAAATAAGEKQRATDLDHLKRLEELSQAEKLNNAETAEAAHLIAVLTERYGDLGLSLDQVTGKITGLSDAQAKVKKQMFAAALAEVDAQIAATDRKYKDAAKNAVSQAASQAFWGPLYTGSGADASMDTAIETRKAQEALREKRKALLMQQEEALTGGAKPDNAGRLKESSAASRKLAEQEAQERARIAGGNEQLQMELHHLKIQQIEDEYTREWQMIQATYDEKRRAAEKAGLDIELVEMARNERLMQLSRKQDEKEAAEQKKFLEDRNRTETSLQDEVDRLKIDTNEALTPEEKARQQMELRHQNELRDLRVSGLDDVQNKLLLFERQDLEAKQLAMGQQGGAALRQSTAGTFNATMVGRMGGGNQLDRIAKATEGSKKSLDALLKKPAAIPAFG